jgi:hypothetical protein
MPESLTLSAAFVIGLFGSAHCVGMCGGIMGALAYAVPPEKRVPAKLLPLLLCYNIGRILSYTLAGAIIGATSWLLAGQFPLLGTILRFLAGLMLVAMGLYLANWWSVLRHLETAGSVLWKRIQPALSALMPVKSPLRALLVGTLWGWIPCGLVYSTLTWAATAGQWQQSAMIMLFFGLGTLPAVLATGMLLEGIKKLLQNRGVRSAAGILIIAFGVWTMPIHSLSGHSSHQQHHSHQPEMQHQDHSLPEHHQDHESPDQHMHDEMDMPAGEQPPHSMQMMDSDNRPQ